MSNYKKRPQVPPEATLSRIGDKYYYIPGRFRDSVEVSLSGAAVSGLGADQVTVDDSLFTVISGDILQELLSDVDYHFSTITTTGIAAPSGIIIDNSNFVVISGDNLQNILEDIDYNFTTVTTTGIATGGGVTVDGSTFVTISGNNVQNIFEDVDNYLTNLSGSTVSGLDADQVTVDDSTFISVSGDNVQNVLEDIDNYITNISISGGTTSGNFVTLDTTQTISGQKTFTLPTYFEGDILPSGTINIGSPDSRFDVVYANEFASSGSPGIRMYHSSPFGVLESSENNAIKLRAFGQDQITLSGTAIDHHQSSSFHGTILIQPTASPTTWEFNSNGYLVSSSGNALVGFNTAQGSDGGELRLTGGGATPVYENAKQRGGHLRLFGQQHPNNAGESHLLSGKWGGKCLVGTTTVSDLEFVHNDQVRWKLGTVNGHLRAVDPNSAKIGLNTSLNLDEEFLQLQGGGTVDFNPETRGAYLQLYGNDVAGIQGGLALITGNHGGHCYVGTFGSGDFKFLTSNTEQWRMVPNGHLHPLGSQTLGTDGFRIQGLYADNIYGGNAFGTSMLIHSAYDLTINTASNDLNLATNGVTNWTVEWPSGFLKGTPGDAIIGVNTADASDNALLQLQGGGPQSSTPQGRGAYIRLYGNELSGGALHALAGLSGGDCLLGTQGAGNLNLRTSGSDRWVLESGGTLRPAADSTYLLGKTTHRMSGVHTDGVYGDAGMEVKSTRDLNLDSAVGYDLIIDTGQNIDFKHLNVSNWIMFSTTLRPASHNNKDIGTTGTKVQAVYAVNLGTFTGTHVYKVKAGETLSEGDAVRFNGQEAVKTTSALDAGCIGIVANLQPASGIDSSGEGTITDSFNAVHVTTSGDYYVHVAQVGDNYAGDLVGFKVCDENGAVSEGDFLCTSNTPGFLMKWTPDINTMNCIVGKAYKAASFDGSGQDTNVYGTLQS
jgi:hypothetical protein